VTDADTRAALDELCRILLGSVGPARGITIDTLTERLGLPDRRATERLIQHNLSAIPCAIVGDNNGLYRPTRAKQINTYIHSLRRRHQPLVAREQITVHKARSENWPEEGGWFIDPPNVEQPELFV
jgi:hypothetical protein